MQQPPMQQGGGGSSTGALLDLLRVLYDPAAVFQRVAQKASFLMPYIGLAIVLILITAVNLPFAKEAMQAQAARTGGPDTSKFAVVGLVFVPVVLALILLIIGFVLWVLTSLVGGDAKFKTLISVAAYSAVPTVVLAGIIGAIILRIQGPGNVTSQQDLQPAVGLDLLLPSVKGFVGGLLKGVNPFGIWGLVLTAIGVSTTHRLSKGSGYMVATGAFILGLLIAGVGGAITNR